MPTRNLVQFPLFRLLASLFAALVTSAQAQIYVGDVVNNTVSAYNLNGTALGGFTAINLGTDPIYGLAVLGSKIYVGNGNTNFVSSYTTAGTLNDPRAYNPPGGAESLSGFAVSTTLIGASYTATGDSHVVLTGTNTIVGNPGPDSASTATGVLGGSSGVFSSSLAVWHNELYAVVSDGVSSVLYHGDFGPSQEGRNFVILPSSGFNGDAEGIATNGVSVYVSDSSAGTVRIYPTSETGGVDFISGLDHPAGLAVANGILYVANSGNGTIGEYDANTGAVINAALISGLTTPGYVAVSAVSAVPEPSSYAALLGAVALGVTWWRRSKRAA